MIYPRVSIIILNWNGKEDTIECLESLGDLKYPNYNILLVDNGSTDDSVNYFRNNYPEVTLIDNKKNLGFAEGNNIAIKWAINSNSDYVLLLNNDTLVDPDFLTRLVDICEIDEMIGIAGPTVYNYPNSDIIQSAGVKILWNTGRQNVLMANKKDKDIDYKTNQVDYVAGCALLAKTKLLKSIGCLNSKYFAYWEETEFCIRAKKNGYKVIHVPNSKIWHKGNASSNKISGFKQYHLTRNRFWFMKQHASKSQYLLFMLYFFGFQFWFNSVYYLIYNQNRHGFFGFLKGTFDGMKNI